MGETEKLHDDIESKLFALRKNVDQWLNTYHYGRATNFDPNDVDDLFERYNSYSRSLRSGYPSYFADLPIHDVETSGTTDFQGRGYIHRKFLEILLMDIDYCLTILSKMTTDKKPDNLDKIEKENLNEKDIADRLFANLITHPKIKQASQNQFKNEEYRPAVLDAMISLEVMIKEKAKYPADNKGKELSGVSLMHKVFDSDNPILSWCKDTRQIDRDELEGYKHIFAGAMQGIRDPKAHAIFQISPMRALKLLTLATLLAELIDASEYVEQDQRKDTTKPKEVKKHNKDT